MIYITLGCLPQKLEIGTCLMVLNTMIISLPLQHSTAKVMQVVTFGTQGYPSFVMLEFQDFSILTAQ